MNSQKGISLLIAFLVMTTMLAVILSVSAILFNKIKIIGDLRDSVSSFNATYSGFEKTLYFDRKQIPGGGNRGLCNICNICPTDQNDPLGDFGAHCNNCTPTDLDPTTLNGCDLQNCINCELTYTTVFDGRTYNVDAKATPNALSPLLSDLYVSSQGFYRNTTRTMASTIQGYLQIVKNTSGGNGPFSFTVAGPTSGTMNLTTAGGAGSTTKIVNVGTYSIVEIGPPIGWTFVSATCNKPYTAISNGVSNVPIEGGQMATCTFTNTKP